MTDELDGAPVSVSVHERQDCILLRFPERRGWPWGIVPAGTMLGTLTSVLYVFSALRAGVTEPWLSVHLFIGVLLIVLSFALLVAAYLTSHAVADRTLREVELSPHRLVFRGRKNIELWRGAIHDVDEVWASEDLVSAVLGFRTDEEVVGLRVFGATEARWVSTTLREWNERHRRGERDEMDRRALALGSAARCADGAELGSTG